MEQNFTKHLDSFKSIYFIYIVCQVRFKLSLSKISKNINQQVVDVLALRIYRINIIS